MNYETDARESAQMGLTEGLDSINNTLRLAQEEMSDIEDRINGAVPRAVEKGNPTQVSEPPPGVRVLIERTGSKASALLERMRLLRSSL